MQKIKEMQKKKKEPPEPVCECGTAKKRGYACYYDAPDGCDIPTKVQVTTRYALLAATIFGTYDVLMFSQAVGFGNMIKRYMVHAIPLVGMSLTFTLVANGALQFRQKDDELNYFLGGLACGPLFGYYVGSGHGVLLGGLLLGAIGIVKKTAVDQGWTFIPNIVPHMGRIKSWRHDYTLARDPKLDYPLSECDDV